MVTLRALGSPAARRAAATQYGQLFDYLAGRAEEASGPDSYAHSEHRETFRELAESTQNRSRPYVAAVFGVLYGGLDGG